ncbi:hypothetical protein EMIT0P218_360024 [Pseudomonas sp. IT-P218]
MRRPDKPLLQGIEYSRERLVDLEAVFAGKPAPTVDRVRPWKMGRLSGRLLRRPEKPEH